jgi:hypothetical protein
MGNITEGLRQSAHMLRLVLYGICYLLALLFLGLHIFFDRLAEILKPKKKDEPKEEEKL